MSTFGDKIRLQRWGIGVLRVVLGVVFLAHGAQKVFEYGLSGTAGAFGQMGIPFPAVSAGLVMTVEFVGGLALVFGFLTRLVTVPLMVTMSVAILAVHLPAGFFNPQGMEFPLSLLAGNVALALAGPGAWALDNVLWRSGDPVVAWLSSADGERADLKAAA